MTDLLLTGFGGYGGRAANPAGQVAKALDGAVVGGHKVASRILPVHYSELGPRIAQLAAEVEPAVIISLGLWPGEPMIRLERIAANIADFEIADNVGALEHGPIVAEGPAAYETSLPIHAIQQRLLERGIPARLSGTAGQFLCNALMYHGLHCSAGRQPAPSCGFIHLPYLPEQVAGMVLDTGAEAKLELHQRGDIASMSLETMVDAVRLAFEVSLEARA